MALIKQGIDISFAKGIDTKTDPKRVAVGNFVSLENTIFEKGGLLQKRNGYAQLPTLPDTSSAYITTLNENLTAVGKNITAYNQSNNTWVSRGSIQPMSVNTLPVIRNNLTQIDMDSVIAPNGLMCTVYLEQNNATVTNKYVISNSVTGQNIVAPTTIPVTSGTVSGGMRVFLLGNYFVIVFTNSSNLQYISINTASPTTVSTNTDIATTYTAATTLSWDGYVVGNKLFIAYNTTSGGQSVHVTFLTSSFLPVGVGTIFAGRIATMMSVTADVSPLVPGGLPRPTVIYASFYDFVSKTGYTVAVDSNLNTLMTPTQIIFNGDYLNIISAAQNGVIRNFYELSHDYAFQPGLPSHYIDSIDVTLPATITTGTVGAQFTSVRSVGIASKAFIVDGVIYYLATFKSAYQPTYFLINGTLSISTSPVVSAKLAYQNGAGYLTLGLPSITITNGNIVQFSYLFKDLIQAVNKNTAVAAGTQVNGIYSQTGINLATIEIGTQNLNTSEIGKDLHLSGGFLWMYDGYLPVEHNFFLYPDTDGIAADYAAWSAAGGSMAAKPDGSTNTNAYYYQFVYEWTDNVGNAFRGAPSIPVAVTTTGAGSAGSVVLNIPTLRLTYKIANPVKITIYRWSAGQQNYYEVTSITAPLLNNPNVDSVTFTDTLSDASILGNALIYTTGGVVEDVNAPAANLITLFDNRLWLVDAEDQNLLWFSKQVIEATPVEMSDLFTMFIAPTTAAQGTTGPITAIAPMDDKLIIFKQNAIYYVNGTGPDNTGANNQYSQPIFITSTVGCANQHSIVFMPQGLMFQSNKGIWLLDRGLTTSYIGAPVEEFNVGTVESAQNIPETNQVRFIMTTGITLMYDYFYGQWGTFTGVPALSSCIYQGLHTFINTYGQAYQESVGLYIDGSNPVLMSFTTGPIRLGDLQNYQRAYAFFLLGSYISPHKLMVGISYDYDGAVSQVDLLSPNNYSTAYGTGPSQDPFGQGNPYGGPNSLERFRVLLQRQRCMAMAITLKEVYDGSFSVPPGAGLTLSGINVICGFKSKWATVSAAKTYG